MTPTRRRRLGGLAAFTGLVLALTACGGGSGDAQGGGSGGGQNSIKLVVAQYTEGTRPYWDELIASFKAKNPGKNVELQVIDWANLQSQVNTMVQTKQFPDILNGNVFADYAEAGLLYKAEEVVSKEVLSDFLPSFAENASYDGVQHGLPFVATVNGMYYNKKILKEAGLDKPPATWDELRTAAKAIKALPGGYVPYALALGAEAGGYEFGTWLRANGGDWRTDGKWAVNGERAVETLDFLKALTKDGYTQPNPGQTNRADGTWPLFAQGKVGMVYASFGTRAFLDQVDKADIDYGTAPFPTNHGAEPATHGIQDYLMAFKKDGNQELVRQFLDYFYQADNYTKYLKVEGLLPTTTSASALMRKDPKVTPIVDMVAKARFDPTSEPVWAELRGTLAAELGATLAPNGDTRAALTKFQQIAERS
ncbi:extracellular solute-binding protein [Spongiactinospora sp. TRM90649]|uniref:extracellular solute-binding protein n=1 Tax=Spongiactinospora sp. TRM90649 TaxID=3031114 RepID=UPI0023F663DF|nr:extracellular solute-binding protein [Spongiactinospora sp. TRM90649]MDF5751143.1 extracellular solute-binding protein [Spongiactinospora sp. TRM90649]